MSDQRHRSRNLNNGSLAEESVTAENLAVPVIDLTSATSPVLPTVNRRNIEPRIRRQSSLNSWLSIGRNTTRRSHIDSHVQHQNGRSRFVSRQQRPWRSSEGNNVIDLSHDGDDVTRSSTTNGHEATRNDRESREESPEVLFIESRSVQRPRGRVHYRRSLRSNGHGGRSSRRSSVRSRENLFQGEQNEQSFIPNRLLQGFWRTPQQILGSLRLMELRGASNNSQSIINSRENPNRNSNGLNDTANLDELNSDVHELHGDASNRYSHSHSHSHPPSRVSPQSNGDRETNMPDSSQSLPSNSPFSASLLSLLSRVAGSTSHVSSRGWSAPRDTSEAGVAVVQEAASSGHVESEGSSTFPFPLVNIMSFASTLFSAPAWLASGWGDDSIRRNNSLGDDRESREVGSDINHPIDLTQQSSTLTHSGTTARVLPSTRNTIRSDNSSHRPAHDYSSGLSPIELFLLQEFHRNRRFQSELSNEPRRHNRRNPPRGSSEEYGWGIEADQEFIEMLNEIDSHAFLNPSSPSSSPEVQIIDAVSQSTNQPIYLSSSPVGNTFSASIRRSASNDVHRATNAHNIHPAFIFSAPRAYPDSDSPSYIHGSSTQGITQFGNMDKPPDPPSGFTVSPQKDDILICPNCGDELCKGETEQQQEVWVVRNCGHVYCGLCSRNRAKSRRTKRTPGVSMPRPFQVCVVEGCGKQCSAKSAMIQAFL